MSLVDFLVMLIVAGFFAGVAQSIVGYTSFGMLASLLFGFFGAVLGVWAYSTFHLPVLFAMRVLGRNFPIGWAAIGAVVFVGFVSLLVRDR